MACATGLLCLVEQRQALHQLDGCGRSVTAAATTATAITTATATVGAAETAVTAAARGTTAGRTRRAFGATTAATTIRKSREAVVLDECHYMNDSQRGTVWEESIIHCPSTIQLVALSATGACVAADAARLPVTPFAQNCSLLVCEETNRAAVFDPGGDLDLIDQALADAGDPVTDARRQAYIFRLRGEPDQRAVDIEDEGFKHGAHRLAETGGSRECRAPARW